MYFFLIAFLFYSCGEPESKPKETEGQETAAETTVEVTEPANAEQSVESLEVISKEAVDKYILSLKAGSLKNSLEPTYLNACNESAVTERNGTNCFIKNEQAGYFYALSYCENPDFVLFGIWGGDNEETIFYEAGDHCAAVEPEPIDSGTIQLPSGYYVVGYNSSSSLYEVYLGCWSCNQFDSESVHNNYGSYGSRFSSDSIRNRFSKWGSQISSYSSCNEFASQPPIIVDENLNKIVDFSVSSLSASSVCFDRNSEDCLLLRQYCEGE